MDRRIVNMATSAVVIGIGVRLAETLIAGGVASSSGPYPHDMSLLAFEWQELWRSVVLIWGLPSALGAFLVACLKPPNWVLYAACAMLPGALLTIERAIGLMHYEIPYLFVLFLDLVNLALLPLFLWLYYALIRRHSPN